MKNNYKTYINLVNNTLAKYKKMVLLDDIILAISKRLKNLFRYGKYSINYTSLNALNDFSTVIKSFSDLDLGIINETILNEIKKGLSK